MKRFLLVLVVLSLGSALAPTAQPQQATPSQTVWTGSWAASPMDQGLIGLRADTMTFREVVHLSLGGSALRVHLSNQFGIRPLTVGSVQVAPSAGQDRTQPYSTHDVTFSGNDWVTIPAGGAVVSDPVAMPVAALSNLTVSIFVPSQPDGAPLTYHAFSGGTNFIAGSNTTTATQFSHARQTLSWYMLTGVDVDAGSDAAAIVALGDSITDGVRSTMDANARWTDVLAARLHANPATSRIGVLDEGISGNRILHDVYGPSALSRLDRDVLAQSGAKYVVVMLGINDIGHSSQPEKPDDVVTVDQLTAGLKQIATRAHAKGLKVYGATLTPYAGSKYQDAAGTKMRSAVNDFIRTSGVFDAVIDFDKVVRDPAHPEAMLPAYDSGDHLHPDDAGYAAMGNSIDLKLFQ